jgi:hypothetical protein
MLTFDQAEQPAGGPRGTAAGGVDQISDRHLTIMQREPR